MKITLFLLSTIGFLFLNSCDWTGTAKTGNPCDYKLNTGDEVVIMQKTSDILYLTTPEANKDCHATFQIDVRFIDDSVARSIKYPPALNVKLYLEEGGEFPLGSYVTHGNSEIGYFFEMQITHGAKNSESKSVHYSMLIRPDFDFKNKVEVIASITYSLPGKQTSNSITH
jgi:hypothetical protein